jgi:Na+/phosphate symporter
MVSENTKKVLKKVFGGDMMIYSIFVYIYSILKALEVVLQMPNWMDEAVWMSLLKDIVIGDAFLVFTGLFARVISGLKNKEIDEAKQAVEDLKEENKRLIDTSNTLLVKTLTSEDTHLRDFAKKHAVDLVTTGVIIDDSIRQQENVELTEQKQISIPEPVQEQPPESEKIEENNIDPGTTG